MKKVIKPFKLSKSGKENYHWRVLIPKEFWEEMQLKDGEFIEISLTEKTIQIKKVETK